MKSSMIKSEQKIFKVCKPNGFLLVNDSDEVTVIFEISEL